MYIQWIVLNQWIMSDNELECHGSAWSLPKPGWEPRLWNPGMKVAEGSKTFCFRTVTRIRVESVKFWGISAVLRRVSHGWILSHIVSNKGSPLVGTCGTLHCSFDVVAKVPFALLCTWLKSGDTDLNMTPTWHMHIGQSTFPAPLNNRETVGPRMTGLAGSSCRRQSMPRLRKPGPRATPGPELHIVSSRCCGPRLGPNTCQREC